ncbi:uncharacterized protein lrrc41 [Myripristis murdjan]|uniref:Leucine-rich repeat-containing protein 41 n=1 Tax=Myripristis murdjan TaxID=586833 RepID=A0A668A6G2_9TELE|nr:leucine-rich repeat-containing protein 41 [Myripristis murdjan]
MSHPNMHEYFAEEVLRRAARTDAKTSLKKGLKLICLRAVGRSFAALDMKAVLELPVLLLKDLLPHLNIVHLAQLQPALKLKGISTHSAWVTILRDIKGHYSVRNIRTEEECKQEAIDSFFQFIFYGINHRCVARYISNMSIGSLLLAVAKHVRRFCLRPSRFLQSLTAEQRPLLLVLEESVRCVTVKQHIDLLKSDSQCAMFVLHRLLDHGEPKELIVYDQDLDFLLWVLRGRGSLYQPKQSQGREACWISDSATTAGEAGTPPGPETPSPDTDDDYSTPCKSLKLEPLSEETDRSGTPAPPADPQACFENLRRSVASCPRSRLESLQIRECGPGVLSMLASFLPSWSCLRSLSLQSCATFNNTEVLNLVLSLQQLYQQPDSSLTHLNVGVLPHARTIEMLLHRSSGLRSLTLEVLPMPLHPASEQSFVAEAATSTDLPLEELSVRVPQVTMSLCSVLVGLRRCPSLKSLHISGIRLPIGRSHRELLTCVSVSNQRLKRLSLEDVQLADCLPQIQTLLSSCTLEELWLRDCRLLEKCSSKASCLQQLVDSVKRSSSLRSFSLAQNRLAESVAVLSELFTGPAPSQLTKLDISSNFIQPADLLHFTWLLEKNRPPQRVTLDLRRNPSDRDPELWCTALSRLRLVCDFLVNEWTLTDPMADHVSNM